MSNKLKVILTALLFLLGVSFLVFVGVRNDDKKAHNIRDVFPGEATTDITQLPGKGTKRDPYRIDSTEALCLFRDNVNRGYSYYGEYVCQTADLDLSGIENWVPIGIFESGAYFEGCYNGAGHTISGLTIYAPGENVGFFGALGGTVVNLGITSGSVTGNCIGAIASHAAHGNARIVNCYSGVSLTGNRIGGIADNFAGAKIYNCLNTGEIPESSGGIVGYNGMVADCFSTTADICHEDFTGTVTDSIGTFYGEGNAETKELSVIVGVLNGNRESLSLNLLDGVQLYGWELTDSGVSLVEKTNWYPLRFILVALAATAALLALNVFLLARNKERAPVSDAPSGWSGGLRSYWNRFLVEAEQIGRVRFLFLMLLQLTLLYSLLAVLCGNSASIFTLTNDRCTGLFCDFYVPLKTVVCDGVPMDSYYAQTGDIYPAAAIFFFRFMALFIPEDYRVYSTQFKMSVPTFVWLIFCVFCLFALYCFLVRRANCGKYRKMLCLGLFCSAPFLFMIERGNVLLFCLVCTAIFLLYYDSDSRFLREFALIALAIAAAIKIYPAIFGLMLVREKRFAQAARCVVYGFTLFFVPFLFLDGADSFLLFVKNLKGFTSNEVAAARDNLINFSYLLTNLAVLFGSSGGAGASLAGHLLLPVVLFLGAASLFTKKRHKAVLALAMLMALTPGRGGYYLLAFYLLPLFFFLMEKDLDTWDLLYVIFLSVCVLPLQFLTGLTGISVVSLWQVCGSAQLVLLVIFITDTCISGGKMLLKHLRKAKAASVAAPSEEER